MKKLAIIFGGKSGEHEISILSATSVYAAVDKKKYSVVPIYITKKGVWLTPASSAPILKLHTEELLKNDPKKLMSTLEALSKKGKEFDFKFSKIDVAFPIMHGSYGEDGTIQGLLEMFNVPYVGCGVASSAITMDKILCKQLMMSHGIPVVPYIEVSNVNLTSKLSQIQMEVEKKFKYPAFVKPANGGSSVGISKVRTPGELHTGLKLAAQYDRRILIEKGLERPREIEIGVYGYGNNFMSSAIGEIIPCNDFYDYEAKYIRNDSKLIIPASLSKKTEVEVRNLALQIFKVLSGEGIARIDFLLNKQDEKIYLNEINSIPGFTSISMYPKLFAANGISYPKLIDTLISIALQRFKDKETLKTTY